jgi:hypothetical protein
MALTDLLRRQHYVRPPAVTRPCGPRPEISEFGALRKFKSAAINQFTQDNGIDRNAR